VIYSNSDKGSKHIPVPVFYGTSDKGRETKLIPLYQRDAHCSMVQGTIGDREKSKTVSYIVIKVREQEIKNLAPSHCFLLRPPKTQNPKIPEQQIT